MSNIEAGQILDANQPQAPSAPTAPKAAPAAPPAAHREDPIAPKLSVLMERERQALNRERMAKAQEEKLKDRLTKVERYEAAKTDPKAFWEVIKDLGWDYDKITQSQLQDGQVPPSVEINQLRSEIDQLRAQLKQEKEQEAEKQRKFIGDQETKAISDFKTEIKDYLKSNEQRYELITFEEADELVFDIIDEHYNRTVDHVSGVGEVMSIAKAADMVEKSFEDKYLKAKDKSKIKAFWNTIPKPIQEQLEKQKSSQPPKTLTNNMGPKVTEKPSRLPEDKRIQSIVNDHVAKMRAQFTG